MTFNANGKMPGVYINEEDVAGPITGVATSTVAFVGPAPQGPLLTPTKITNWTEFKKRFGEGFKDRTTYAHYAVRGFFENGGSVCYFVRVGKAKKSFCDILDQEDKLLFTLKAKTEGAAGDGYTVEIKEESLLQSKVAVCADVIGISGDGLTISVAAQDIAKFAAEDVIAVFQQDVGTEVGLHIKEISGNNIVLNSALTGDFDLTQGVPKVYLENLKGRTFVTLESVDKLDTGSYLSFVTGEAASTEVRRLDMVDPGKKAVYFKTALKSNIPLSYDKQAEVVSNEFHLVILNPEGDSVDDQVFAVDDQHEYCIYKAELNSMTVERNGANCTKFPKNTPKASSYTTEKGADEFSSPMTANDFIAGIQKLKTVEDVNMLCVPDCVNIRDKEDESKIDLNAVITVQQEMITHCEDMMDRFAILDPIMGCKDDENMDYVEKIKNHKLSIGIGRGKGFGAYYSPWLIVAPLEEGDNKLVPPSGYVAGIYARSDNSYGVHQAPAGEFLPFSKVLGVERELESGHHGQLNDEGINVIRILKGVGAVIWGARTITPKNKQWKYINVRRLMLYIEESILEATRSLVFRPNNKSLWQTVKRQLNGFLTRTWQSGALVGDTSDKAFSVKVDEELNPPETLADGMLFIEVKVYPTTPAEYIVFQIIQQPGGSWVKE